MLLHEQFLVIASYVGLLMLAHYLHRFCPLWFAFTHAPGGSSKRSRRGGVCGRVAAVLATALYAPVALFVIVAPLVQLVFGSDFPPRLLQLLPLLVSTEHLCVLLVVVHRSACMRSVFMLPAFILSIYAIGGVLAMTYLAGRLLGDVSLFGLLVWGEDDLFRALDPSHTPLAGGSHLRHVQASGAAGTSASAADGAGKAYTRTVILITLAPAAAGIVFSLGCLLMDWTCLGPLRLFPTDANIRKGYFAKGDQDSSSRSAFVNRNDEAVRIAAEYLVSGKPNATALRKRAASSSSSSSSGIALSADGQPLMDPWLEFPTTLPTVRHAEAIIPVALKQLIKAMTPSALHEAWALDDYSSLGSSTSDDDDDGDDGNDDDDVDDDDNGSGAV